MRAVDWTPVSPAVHQPPSEGNASAHHDGGDDDEEQRRVDGIDGGEAGEGEGCEEYEGDQGPQASAPRGSFAPVEAPGPSAHDEYIRSHCQSASRAQPAPRAADDRCEGAPRNEGAVLGSLIPHAHPAALDAE